MFRWFVFSCIFSIASCSMDYDPTIYRVGSEYRQRIYVLDRLLLSMRSFYQDAEVRIKELNNERWMYEESPHYESGYIMGEIIERYKTMVEQAHVAHTKTTNTTKHFRRNVPELVYHVEAVQKLYFEVYHLVAMLHEVFQKYRFTDEFAPSLSGPPQAVYDEEKVRLKELKEREDHIKKQAKAKRQKKKEQRHAKYFGINNKTDKIKQKTMQIELNKRPYNKFWPLDYGFELDYKW